MKSKLAQWWDEKPLVVILSLAFVVRLIAVFFAKGYLMHDDHFLTVEISGGWANGYNYSNWIPTVENQREHPEPISFFYLGGLYFIFKSLIAMGIENPQVQMYLMRFIHLLLSLGVIYWVYQITLRISNLKSARTVALVFAMIAMLNNFAVRNLVEMVCQVPLLLGFYLLVKHQLIRPTTWGKWTFQEGYSDLGKTIRWPLILAALIMGLSVGIRYQTVLFAALVGFVFVVQRQFWSGVVFGVFSFLGFFLTQIDDILLWGGEPFQHLTGYIEYNKKNSANYPGAPFTYVSLVGFYILPPISLFLLFGFLRSWRKHLMLFLPAFGFLLFHILFPNKQERFIVPMIPFMVMLGVLGWNEWVAQSTFWKNRTKLLKACWTTFWALNTVVLCVMIFTYSKKARVEAMEYLYDQGDVKNMIVEFSHSENSSMMPVFYSDSWHLYYTVSKKMDWEHLVDIMPNNAKLMQDKNVTKPEPNYVIFLEDIDLDKRVERVKKSFPTLTFEKKVEAGWFDQLLHQMNPRNRAEEIFIYKIN